MPTPDLDRVALMNPKPPCPECDSTEHVRDCVPTWPHNSHFCDACGIDFTPERCRADDGELCKCYRCRVEYERLLKLFKPLYDAEKRAGILPREHYTTEEWEMIQEGLRTK